MRSILSAGGREVLQEFARSRVLVGFDFDGTLAPIVTSPARASMRPTTRTLLHDLANRYPCLVISGRARPELLGRLKGSGVSHVVGNHGLELGRATPRSPLVRRWRLLLERKLAGLRGVVIEDKRYSLAVHYRRSRSKKAALAAILAAGGGLEGVRIIGGKQVVNLVPVGAPHKGIALERARVRAGCDTAVFVGDDDTDEDVFARDDPGRLLTIRVGMSRRSLASYYLRRQTDIDQLLRILVAARPAGS